MKPSTNRSSDRPHTLINLALMGLLTWLAFALRVYKLGARSLWYDELLELDVARGPLEEIGPQLAQHAAMPLDYYLLHAWMKLGQQDLWVRLPALFWGVLAIPLTFALTRRLFNRRVGWIAAALMAVALFAVRYSQEARPYAMLLCFTIITFLGLWQVYATHRLRYWLVVIIGLSGAALSHYFALFLLLPMALFVGWRHLHHPKEIRYWRHTACFGLTLLVLTLIFAVNGRLLVLYSVSYRFSSAISQPETLTQPAAEKPNLGTGPPLEADFVIENILSPLSAGQPTPMLLYYAFFVIGLVAMTARQSDHRAAMFLLGWLILPIVLIYTFLLHRGTFFASRYILYTWPAFLIFVAYGIDRAARLASYSIRLQPIPAGVIFALTAVVLLSLAQAEALRAHYLADSREDWRAVGDLLHRHAAPDDAVIAVKAEPAINWYYPPAAAKFGTYLKNQAIRDVLEGHPRRWFILSSYSYKRDEGLRDWLRQHQAIKIVIDRRVVVYLQQEGQSRADLLAQVKHFSLPQKARTYGQLAAQFREIGDLQTSRAFYQKAVLLAESSALKADYQARLAALPHLTDQIITRP